jgi:sec-independent protein translocase protein TatB
MIDVGFWEVAMIGVLALIILGPERLPGVARTAGTWMGKARRMMNDLKSDIKSELNEADLNELKNIRDDIQQAGEGFKSQVEKNQDKLQEEGSAMDTAIASALSKPVPGADASKAGASKAKKKTSTNTKKVTRTTKKKVARKKAPRAKLNKKEVAKKKAPTPNKEKSG